MDIGVRVELPAVIFSHLTDELYESKIVYRTEKFEDNVRTFCMNPYGIVVNENTNGIVTVNGHSYDSPDLRTENTNFALLVAKHFSEPFKDSNGYGESIARLSNMLGGGVIVQRFGDLTRGRRSTAKRIEDMGADSICIKDMAGLLLPYKATELLNSYLKEGIIRKYGGGKTVVYLKR